MPSSLPVAACHFGVKSHVATMIPRLLAATQRRRVFERTGPRFAEIVGPHFVQGKEEVAPGDQQFLHRQHDARRWRREIAPARGCTQQVCPS